MSTTIIAVIVQILAVGLPYIGISVGTEELTTTATTLVVVGTGIWIWIQRVSKKDVDALGRRKA